MPNYIIKFIGCTCAACTAVVFVIFNEYIGCAARVHHIATHDRLGACFLPTESLRSGPPLHSIPYALGYGEEAIARIQKCGGATMVRGSLLFHPWRLLLNEGKS